MGEDEEKLIALSDLEYCLERYLETGNAVHVWRGYCAYRSAGIDMPDWIRDYFDKCAREIITFLSVKEYPEVGQTVSRSDICNIFQLKESFATSFHKESEPLMRCFKIFPYLLYDNLSLDQACLLASYESKNSDSKGVSKKSFRDAWKTSGHIYVDSFRRHYDCLPSSNVYKAFMQCDKWDSIKHLFKNSSEN